MIKNIKIAAALAVFAFVLIGAPSHALASASFNTDPQDFATVRVSNYTQNPNCYTCWSGSANANAGEVVAVTVYYHNTGNQAATGTLIKLNQPQAASSYHNFSGNVSASNTAAAYGSATINLSSSQTLTFISGTAVWYPNQSSQPQSLPFGQSGTEIFGNGINIGNINSGWSSQGSVVLRFQVSSTQALVACNDGIDNDMDGLIDMNDPGCSSSTDTDEYNTVAQTAPVVVTNAATSVGQNSATLNGNFTAVSSGTTTWFTYSTSYNTLVFGGGTTVGQVSQASASGSMSYILSGLAPGTTYYFRAVGQNNIGTTDGSILNFTTSSYVNTQVPAITTDYSDNIGSSYATLHGTYNSNNSSTITWFEYSTSYSSVSNGNGSISNQTNQGTGAGALSQYISGLQSGATYYFRAAGQNSNGVSYGSILNFTTSGSNNYQAPDISTDYASSIGQTYATLHGDYDSNGSNTTTWFEYGTTNSFGYTTSQISQGTGSDSFAQYISGLASNTTYYFRAVGYNNYGTDYGATLTFTTSGNVPPPSSTTTALTSLATGVSQTYATLNGLISNNSNSAVTAWFEYGTSASLGLATASQSLGSGSSMSYLQSVSGLIPDTMYYFRAVAKTNSGVSTGEIFIFKTASASSPVVVAPTPSSSAPTSSKFVFLKIENRYDAVASGDVIDYTITYKNISSRTLNKVVVQAVLPKEVKFKKSDRGEFDSNTNMLTVNVGTLAVGDEGTINVQAKALSSVKNKDFILTNALMKYTNPITTAQEEAIAYVLNSVSKTSSLAAASIFGDGGFLPTTLLGWLLLTLVIFGLIFFGRKLYAQAK